MEGFQAGLLNANFLNNLARATRKLCRLGNWGHCVDFWNESTDQALLGRHFFNGFEFVVVGKTRHRDRHISPTSRVNGNRSRCTSRLSRKFRLRRSVHNRLRLALQTHDFLEHSSHSRCVIVNLDAPATFPLSSRWQNGDAAMVPFMGL